MNLFFLTVLLSVCLSCYAQESVQEALVKDMFPPTSAICAKFSNPLNTHFQDTFYKSNQTDWYHLWEDDEDQVFLLEMGHKDTNDNRTWTLRVGKAGNIYSYIGKYGEAVPPQQRNDSPWMDEVWQRVSVNTSYNLPTAQYYIHQAGTYHHDSQLTHMFYSPNLASYFGGVESGFVTWGQQAHIPTTYPSPVLYYNRYVDCGNGVLEVTSVIHNAAPLPSSKLSPLDTPVLNYINMPWGGVRPSTLKSPFEAKADGSGSYAWPEYGWGSSGEVHSIQNTDKTGGYFTFAQNVVQDTVYSLPCGDGSGHAVPCSSSSATRVVLEMSRDSPCGNGAVRDGQMTVQCHINPTVPVSDSETSTTLLFTTQRGESFAASGVWHWSYGSTLFIFFPLNLTTAELNKILHKGDILSVQKYETIPIEDNLALSFVHGKDPNWRAVSPTPARIRCGTTGRDYTVYTQNVFPKIAPGDTYRNRQFIISDQFLNMDNHSSSFVPSTYQDKFSSNPHPTTKTNIQSPSGRAVYLYTVKSGASQGVTVTVTLDNTTCWNGEKVVCVGRTVPTSPTSFPLFFTQCGADTHIGKNPYVFTPSPSSSGGILRPYLCDGQDQTMVQPQWSLLGFFEDGACSPIQDANYIPDGC